MSDTSGVYIIRNTTTGQVYVGSSVEVRRRLRGHRQMLRNKSHHSAKLQAAWDEHGEDAFTFEVLEPVDGTRHERWEREQHWLEFHRSAVDGYNVYPHASGPKGYAFDADVIAKRSAKQVGRKPSPEHLAAQIAGLRRPEVRAKISASTTGKPKSPETLERMRAASNRPEVIAAKRAGRLRNKLLAQGKAP